MGEIIARNMSSWLKLLIKLLLLHLVGCLYYWITRLNQATDCVLSGRVNGLYQGVPYFQNVTVCRSGPGSSVSIATDYGLDGLGNESQWGQDFPPHQTGPGAHPASCKMGTGSFPGVKCGRGVLLNTHPLLVRLSWKSRAILSNHPLGHTGPVTGTLYLLHIM